MASSKLSYLDLGKYRLIRHPREGGDPVCWCFWIPVFAGMTNFDLIGISLVHAGNSGLAASPNDVLRAIEIKFALSILFQIEFQSGFSALPK